MGTKNEGFYRRSKGGDFRKSRIFGLGRLPTHATTFQEEEILRTLVYFHPTGLFGWFRNCLKSFL